MACSSQVALADDPNDAVVLHCLHNNNSSVVAKHETYGFSDLDAGFQETLSDIVRAALGDGTFATKLSAYVDAARRARFEEGEFRA